MTPGESRFGALLKEIGDDYLTQRPADPLGARRAALERVAARRRLRFAGAGVAVATAVAAVLVTTLVVPDRTERPVFPAGPISTIRVGAAPVSVAVLDDFVAVGHAAGEPVRLVDIETGDVTSLDVEWSDVAGEWQRLWGVSGDGRVESCNLESRLCRVAHDDPRSKFALAQAGTGTIYFATSSGDPELHADRTGPRWSVRLPDQRVSAIAGTKEVVAVATTSGNTRGHVLLLDVATGEERARVTVGREVTDLVWVQDELWGTSPDEPDYGREPGKLFRFDPGDLSFETFGTGKIEVTWLANGGDILWGASESQGTVTGFDVDTGGRIRGPLVVGTTLSDLAPGHGALWATDMAEDVLVRIDPSRIPHAPGPKPTADRRCSTIPFWPTYLPPGFQERAHAGSGGGAALPGALGHWRGADEGTHITVVEGDLGLAPVAKRRVEVLGTTGAVGRIKDGFAVRFSSRGCDWSLLGYGVGRAEMKWVAQYLVDPEVPLVPRGGIAEAFAVWPEHTRAEGERACRRAGQSDLTWRKDPKQTAIRFAEEILKWNPSVSFVSERWETQVTGVLQEGDHSTRVFLRRFGDCWWVVGADVGNGNGIGGYSVVGNSVRVVTEPREAATAEVEVAFDSDARGTIEVPPGEVAEFRFERPITAPGYILVLYRDDEGRVIEVSARAAAPGDAVS